ncbi:MAG: hypothetical protein Q8O64_15665, partial [Sideroxyarcus sp.]|nr:hypothetical protein [Sideroxyarcus sp.]
EQRWKLVKKAENSFFSSIPAWASIERARQVAVEQADVDWAAAEEARKEAEKQADAEWEAELAAKLAAYNAARVGEGAGGPGNPVLEGPAGR